jgi:DNA-binding HxlR family transcriptional regulator
VLNRLAFAGLRTSQLQRALEEIAPKVLTETLRGLERDGLVHRTVFSTAPLCVEYKLTAEAQELLPVLDHLSRWSELYGQQALLARKKYDTRNRPERSAAELARVVNAIVDRRGGPDVPRSF